MNYENYTTTDYGIKKKYKRTDYILVLTKFKNDTRNISTPISPVSWYESWDDGLQKDRLINLKTGEIIVQWDKDNIIYISEDYEVDMMQKHKVVEDATIIKQHNDYIKYRSE